MKNFFTLILFALLGTRGIAQTCLLDSTFGTRGKAIGFTNFNNSPHSANIIVQPDGKIIQAWHLYTTLNNYGFRLIRYNSNGSLDANFGSNGIVTTSFSQSGDDFVAASALQADGKIIVAGTTNNQGNYDFALARYKSNGTLDSSFGINGKLTTALGPDQDYASSVLLQSDGKIIVAGSTSRLDSILCPGSPYYVPVSAIVRYNSNGSLDSSFGKNGKIVLPLGKGYDHANSLAFQQDGKIVVAGTSYYSCGCGYYGGAECYNSFLVLTRLNNNGSVDSTFGKNGKATDSLLLTNPSSVALQPDGKIVVTGRGLQQGFIAERFNSNGKLDSSFANGGKVLTIIGGIGMDDSWSNAITIQPDGKIVLAGGVYVNGTSFSDFAIVRYSGNGSLDTTFNKNGIVVIHVGPSGSYDMATGVALQGSKIIAGGYSRGSNPSGSIQVIRFPDSFNQYQLPYHPKLLLLSAKEELSLC